MSFSYISYDHEILEMPDKVRLTKDAPTAAAKALSDEKLSRVKKPKVSKNE